MHEIHDNQIENERAILVAIETGEYDLDVSLNELEELAQTANIDVIGRMTQVRDRPDKATFIGKGKLEELSEYIKELEADIVIFDHELSATQIRNIEAACEVPVIDRTMLILEVFAGNAVTSEGRLQVELAQHKYLLPRLSGMGKSLSRLGGGGGGGGGARRGKGETKLELDRRHIRRHIEKLADDLKEMVLHREQSRKRRNKLNVPTVALIGYTNVGKSTLLNRLTDAQVLVENKLFATLDPTAKSLELPNGQCVILIDTVGFVRRLPHHLVEAFKSTLEEAVSADLLLNVCDASSPEVYEQIEVTEKIISDLGAEDKTILNVINKKDIAEVLPEISGKAVVYVSAKTGEGMDEMLEKISELLPDSQKRLKLLIPYDKGAIASEIRENGKIFTENFENEGVFIDALVDKKLVKSLSEYIIDNN